MWRTSGRFTSCAKFSPRRPILVKQSVVCEGSPRKVLQNSAQQCTVRHMSNGATAGRGGSGIGKIIGGATVLATGTVVGGVYYAKSNPSFRKSVEDKIPGSASLLTAVLGKKALGDLQQAKQINERALDSGGNDSGRMAVPSLPATPSSLKDITGSQLFSSDDDKLGSHDESLSDKSESLKTESAQETSGSFEIIFPNIVPQEKVQENISASVSSIDQIAVSSVDLDILKAVERGVSEAKKEASSSKKKTGKTSKDGSEGSKESSKKKSKKKKKEEKEEMKSEDEKSKADQKETTDKSAEAATDQSAKTSGASVEMTALDVVLQTAMATVSELGQKAIDYHEHAIAAVRLHRDSLKEALQSAENDVVSKEHWETLCNLSETKTKALEDAKQAAAKLNDLIDKLQVSVTEAKEKGLEASAEVASETLAKLTYGLQQVKNHLKETQAEGTGLKQFQDFIEESKQHLREELASIRPVQDTKLDDKADEQMLAYAQKRIRLLEDTLEQREKQEKQVMEEVLRKQQSELDKLAHMRLKHEVEKIRTELNDLMRQKEAEAAELHENDLRQQLRRQAAAFGDHLNEVLKVQATDLDVKHQSEMREKLLLTRHEFDLKLRGTLARLNGVIAAVENRADVDKKNNEAQELWLACQSLSTALTGLGDDHSRLYPVHNEAENIRRVSNGNEVVTTILDSLSEDVLHRGVYPEEVLRRRFPNVKKVCKQVALIGEEGGGVWSHLLSFLQSLLVFDIRDMKHPTMVDLEELDTYQLLALAGSSLDEGATEQAVRYMNQLRGEPRRVAKDWIQEARLFLEARQAAQFLMSFASAYNIGADQQK